MTIGERIREERLAQGLSQEELALKCGYKSRTSINKYEIARNMSLNKVELIAKALHVPPSYLMGWTDRKGTPLSWDEDKHRILHSKWERLSLDEQAHIMAIIDILINR